jgi:glyoxylase-like metal-dependent hydrolase (beta-lactamase superfamily II)
MTDIPVELAKNLILLKKGTHNFQFLDDDSILARYSQVTASTILYLGDSPVIIDPGARYFRNLIEKRVREYVDPLKIEFCIATHYHHDHLDNADLFPNATRILDYGMVTPDGVMTVYKSAEMIPVPSEIEIFSTPGHVKNHISVRIRVDGINFVCAGDSVRDDILNGDFCPDYVDATYISSAKRVFELADVIIPGHGEIIKVDRNHIPPLFA